MSTAATREQNLSKVDRILFLAFELSDATWKLGFTTGYAQKIRIRDLPSGDLDGLVKEIELAKARFELVKETKVVSCYEAGRDGFWIHRALESLGVENMIVDSSSIEVSRRRRRAKSDGLDVRKLSILLMRHHLGEPDALKAIAVPSVEEEDARHLHRSRDELIREKTSLVNRIKGLGISQGLRLEVNKGLPKHLARARLWNGSRLPEWLRDRILRVYRQWEFVREEIRGIEKLQDQALEEGVVPGVEQARRLQQLKGIGRASAWVFSMEFFGWRRFRNGKEVGSLAGLTPTPYSSGEDHREQGIGKDGNKRVRAMAVEIAWGWLRYQPRSELTLWFSRRFGEGARNRRIGIVAVARKLLVHLWKYLETGEIPPGAELKSV